MSAHEVVIGEIDGSYQQVRVWQDEYRGPFITVGSDYTEGCFTVEKVDRVIELLEAARAHIIEREDVAS